MRYQSVLQHSEEDCSAACIATVAKHYGRTFAISRVREAVGTGSRGTSLLGLSRGAETLGFNARQVKASEQLVDQLNKAPLPAIIHWKGYHWIVLYAYFNNAIDIQNIISRVTGGSVSNIDGLIGTNGTANLFLINPNGIIFGVNASLNIGGSFVASTANALQFGNIGFFSATDKNIPSPLLTINPSALLFNQINQNAVIQNSSVAFARKDPAGFNAFGLRVPDGKSLLLVGGNVSMDGGQLNAFGGRVELGGLGEPGTVALGIDGDNFSLIFPEDVRQADISFTNRAGVFVEGAGGGNITVNARNIDILESSLSAGIGRGLGSVDTVAGDITLNAIGEIKAIKSYIVNNLQLRAIGNGGNVTISSDSLSLSDGAQLQTNTSGQGDAGSININARDTVSFNRGVAISNVLKGAVGKSGNINITTGSLSLINGGQLSSSTFGQGKAGNITINAPNGFIVAVPNENSDITANAYKDSGGRVDIQAFGIYGIQPRPNPTSLSDITASSEFGVNGIVELNTPDINPSSGLVNLPTVPVDTQVAQTCTAGSTVAKSSFTITGRGGLPPNPGEALNTDAVQVDLVTLKPEVGKPSTPVVSTNPTSQAPDRIVEATGWAIAANGDIILTSAPTLTPDFYWQKTADCRALNQQ